MFKINLSINLAKITKNQWLILSLLLLIVLLLSLSGCASSTAQNTRELEKQLQQPQLPLQNLGQIALELAERYEEAGNMPKALQNYKRALWAFKLSGKLTADLHPLLDHARDSIKRISGKIESRSELQHLTK